MTQSMTVWTGGTDGYHTYRIPALTVTPAGTVLLFCEGRRNGPGDAGDIDLLVKRSTDGGRSWSAAHLVYAEPGDITIGNPCPIADGDTVHLLFTRNNKGLFATESADDGRSWSAPRDLSAVLTAFPFHTVRVGTGPGHGIRTRTGRLLAPIWLCDGEVRDTERTYRSGIAYSDDHGLTWMAGGLAPALFPKLNECAICEKGDGALLLNMRGAETGCRVVSVSRDNGATWSDPEPDLHLPCPTCQAGLLRTSAGRLLFSNPCPPPDGGTGSRARRNLTVKASLDDGRTWPDAIVLHDGPAAYSDLAETADGTILCAYERGVERYHESIAIARFAVL